MIKAFFNNIFSESKKNPPVLFFDYFLTKSRFLQYDKCPRYIWLQVNETNLLKKQDLKYSYESDKVSKFARKLFPDSIYQYNTSSKQENIDKTLHHLTDKKTIFNAVIGIDSLYAQVDILEPAGGYGWNIYELKNSPSLKKREIIKELTFQKFIAESLNMKINGCYAINVNSEFKKEGDVNPENLFNIHDFTNEVNLVNRTEFDLQIKELLYFLKKEDSEESIKNSCKTPKSCRASTICWGELEESDIFHLREGTDQSIKYYNKGVRFIQQIPEEDELTFKQSIQVKTEKLGIPHIDKNVISEYIESIRYPVYYLDFETINSSIPIYERSRPFQHIPFQYSLHIQQTEKSSIEHHEYIDAGAGDPRQEILALLSKLILPGGTIVCFEDTFEKRCLRESADIFPEYNEWYKMIVNDFFDLAMPFKAFAYYHPEQKGSTSLKKVVAALTGSGYESLHIKDGYSANFEFLKIKTGELSPSEKKQIYFNLAEYCKQDTWSLHLVLNQLREMVR